MWELLDQGFVYDMPPIDWWPAWSDLDQAVAQHGGDKETQTRARTELERIRDHALREFRDRTSWEGDIIKGPVFAGIPPGDGNPDADVMVAIKQFNNGSVFVWSPYDLSWLAQYAV